MTTTKIKLFDFVDPPTPDHLDVLADESLRYIDFPWYRIIPGLRSVGKSRVTVIWVDGSTLNGNLGDYTHSTATIRISNQFGVNGTAFTFAHECGHLVDFCTLSYSVQSQIKALSHSCRCQYHYPDITPMHAWAHEQPHSENWVALSSTPYFFRHNEAYADAFVAAFAPEVWGSKGVYGRFVHWPTGYDTLTSHYDQIRTLTLQEPIMAFSDVPPTHAHAEGINWAAGEGIVSGYPDGTFKPNEPVSRGAFCTMLKRYDDLEPHDGS